MTQPTDPPTTGPAAPPTYPYPYLYPVQPRTSNGLAIASMVLGIVWIYWIGSLLALIFGIIALRQIEKSGGTQGGRGMAIAGIVLGWVGLAVVALFIIIMVISAATSSGGY